MSFDTQIASAHAAPLFFIQFDFTTGTYYFTSWSHSLDWNSHTWLGLGAIVEVGGVSSAERIEYPSLDVGLSIADPSLLALALGASSTYRNRPATVWLGVLDDDFKLALSPGPQLYWAGVMDQVRLATGDGEGEPGAVVMRCENPCRDSRGPLNLRLNHAQHIARHPGDTGLSRIEQLTGQPQLWLSKKFQEIH